MDDRDTQKPDWGFQGTLFQIPDTKPICLQKKSFLCDVDMPFGSRKCTSNFVLIINKGFEPSSKFSYFQKHPLRFGNTHEVCKAEKARAILRIVRHFLSGSKKVERSEHGRTSYPREIRALEASFSSDERLANKRAFYESFEGSPVRYGIEFMKNCHFSTVVFR
ncbi:hypothetical protein CEXT_584731 [Caerostris extrusa]|uniref:Uncharacterized protein n=1 Tax=Caerostris extrusa TaxID=172846 RepID=A0AAV4P2E9_CAEEX|nr:hypothetical protein CEXT_584731 [Caerostris extrusa]